jgi:hypothetical protein
MKTKRPPQPCRRTFPLLTGGSGRSILSRQGCWRRGMGRRPICAYQGKRKPGRVVHSAKSWALPSRRRPVGAFSALGVDRSSPRAEDLTGTRHCTDSKLCAGGPGTAGFQARFAFDNQEITITVPASFDAAAQRLTIAAAEEAGFPRRATTAGAAGCVLLLAAETRPGR